LRFLINPSYFFYSVHEYAQDLLSQTNLPPTTIGRDAVLEKTWEERGKKTITILVLGETARAENFSLNGYFRDTNPMLRKEEVINFSNFYACGTSTAVSLPCMFSHLGQKKYKESKAKRSENILDVLSHAGIRVLWRDNNSGCKGVCSRIEFEKMDNLKNKGLCSDSECYDEIMIQGLQSYVDSLDQDAFIVLHQKGSHGPAYYLRYPDSFKIYEPVCNSSQLDKCPRQEIINAYDNSILYTDYFLSLVIDFLKKNSDTFYTAMIYVSDHGESLGENNIYLHGLPYQFAPDEQKRVPFILWFSKGFEENYGIDRAHLESIGASRHSHDNLFDSVLGLLDIQTKEYDPQQDIFAGVK
jgi:lipid A ethanolaminephosphotransferase